MGNPLTQTVASPQASGSDYIVTFLSSRHSTTGALEGSERLTAKSSAYTAGRLGMFVYAHTGYFDVRVISLCVRTQSR